MALMRRRQWEAGEIGKSLGEESKRRYLNCQVADLTLQPEGQKYLKGCGMLACEACQERLNRNRVRSYFYRSEVVAEEGPYGHRFSFVSLTARNARPTAESVSWLIVPGAGRFRGRIHHTRSA